MATWQIGYRLVPRNKITTAFGRVPESISREQYETNSWWDEFNRHVDLSQHLDAILPRRSSWSADVQAWGMDEGNRVDVWAEAQEIVEVTARVDARAPHDFADGLSTIASDFGLVGVTDEYKVHELSRHQLLLDVATSPAARFVADPKKFLTTLDQKPKLNLE